MRKKTKVARRQLTRLGGPAVGTVAALAVTHDQGYTVLVGARAGLFRAAAEPGEAPGDWERLANAPTGILTLAASPTFSYDQRLLAGTNTGLFISSDGGETWRAAGLPMADSTVTTIAYSPNYEQDGLVLAGTLEDGIIASPERGERFFAKSFGLLDSSVLALAFSPNFAADGTVFAGTESTPYYSYNGGLAWKELPFPEGSAPILSLAVSPTFAEDHTVYAGTEAAGLYRSTDQGKSWQRLDFPAEIINALTFAPGGELVAATDAGVFRSTDAGANWTVWLDQPNVIGLALSPEISAAGVVNQGVWLSAGGQAWQPLPGLSARSLLGLTLAPNFGTEPTAFSYGPQEGLWRSTDGGQNWFSLAASLPSLDIAALAISPNFAKDRTLVAAALEGVSVSTNAGDTWERRADPPANLVGFSPNGQFLVVSYPAAGLRVSVDFGRTWLGFPGPWDLGGSVAALAIGDNGHFYVGHLEGVGETISLWRGLPKELSKAMTKPIGKNPQVSFYLPADASAGAAWYAAWGHEVWSIGAKGSGHLPAAAAVFDPAVQTESLTGLTGGQGPDGHLLVASTGQHVYTSADGQAWTEAFDFGQDRAVALTLSPTFAADRTAYVLLLGGSMCAVTL